MSVKGKDIFQAFMEKNQWSAFDRYAVRIRMVDIAGGVPKDPKLIDAWLSAHNKELNDASRAELRDATMADLPDVIGETADKSTIGFKRNADGELCIEGRNVKAMLKETSNVIKKIAPAKGKKGEDEKGITNLKSKVAERLFVEEDLISLGLKDPHVVDERPIHVMTAQGPRDSIKRTEVVRDVEIAFTLRRMKGNEVPEDTMLAILQYGQQLGLGADRSQGRGQFTVVSVEKL